MFPFDYTLSKFLFIFLVSLFSILLWQYITEKLTFKVKQRFLFFGSFIFPSSLFLEILLFSSYFDFFFFSIFFPVFFFFPLFCWTFTCSFFWAGVYEVVLLQVYWVYLLILRFTEFTFSFSGLPSLPSHIPFLTFRRKIISFIKYQ